MNRLFGGKSARRQQQSLVQHSLLDDDDDDDPFDTRTNQAEECPVYLPPPTTLLPEQLQKEVAMQSSPKAASRSGVSRYASSNGNSPLKCTPLSPKQTIDKFPRRFSSPDRKPHISAAVPNGKVSMMHNLRERMKLGLGGQTSANSTSPEKIVAAFLPPPSGPLTPQLNDPFSEPFSEPFKSSPTSDGVKIKPASEAFTISCSSEELDRLFQQSNCVENVIPSELPKPKLKFSISSEPLPKQETTSMASKNISESKSDDDGSPTIINDDNSGEKVEPVKDIILPGRHESIEEGNTSPIVQAEVGKRLEALPEICSSSITLLKSTTKKSNGEGNDDKTTNAELKLDDDTKEKAIHKKRSSTKSPQKRSSLRNAQDPSRAPEKRSSTSKRGSKTPTKADKLTNTKDVADEAEDETKEILEKLQERELKKSGSRDFAPKTPKRIKSSDNELDFGIAHDENVSKNVLSSSEGDAKEEKKESKRTSKSKDVKNSSKDDKIKTSLEKEKKRVTGASPSKAKDSTKVKTKERSSKIQPTPDSPKKSKASMNSKSKRRNSTNTSTMLLDDCGGLSIDSTKDEVSEKAERRNSTGYVQEKPPKLPNTKTKRRNSCTSIISALTEVTLSPLKQSNKQQLVALPAALKIDEDVPPWVKAAMHMIEQYQKNKQYTPTMDPVANLLTNTTAYATPNATLSKQEWEKLPAETSPKLPTRKDSDSSSAYSTSSSKSDDRKLMHEKEVSKWVPIISIDAVTSKSDDCTLDQKSPSSPGPVGFNLKSTNSLDVEKLQTEAATEMKHSIPLAPGTKDGINTCNLDCDSSMKNDEPNLPLHSKDAPTVTNVQKSIVLANSADGSSSRAKTPIREVIRKESSDPLRQVIRNASYGPKISLHASSLLKRDNTPSRNRADIDSSNKSIQNGDVPKDTNAVPSKEKFRELRRLARKAANEPVSSDDECDDSNVNQNQLQRPVRVGGRKSSFRVDPVAKESIGEKDALSSGANCQVEANELKDATGENPVVPSKALPSNGTKQERRGSAAFQKLRRIAQRTANEPLSDDEESKLNGNVNNVGEVLNPGELNEKVAEDTTCQSRSPTSQSATKVRPTPNRMKSKSFENVPSIQQRKQILFEK